MSPDHRQHRGPHPDDARLFASDCLETLRRATAELSWLLTRGYAMPSSLKLVGDRYNLTERQRVALSRAACPDASRDRRMAACLDVAAIRGEALIVDGFNLLITIEAALGGGLILCCRDGCLRDLSSLHGSYKAVQETDTALHRIGETLAGLEPGSVAWLLDRPISNSGRLAQRIREMAQAEGWPWSAEVVLDPDVEIPVADKIAITSDSIILDRVQRWTNLAAAVLRERAPDAWLLDLRV